MSNSSLEQDKVTKFRKAAENVIKVKDGEWPAWATPDRIAPGAYIIGPDARHYRFPW